MSGARGLVRLYVAGPSPRTEAAWHTVQTACKVASTPRFDVELVDVSERPDEARRAGIMLTPALVRINRGEERRWLGDFTDVEAVARALVSDDV
ncbi:MAG: circadian clock KaiB family protein [Gemmatimonadota bacterium]